MEHISLGSDKVFADSVDVDAQKVISSLEQKHRHVPGRQTLQLLEPHFLQVKTQRMGKQKTILLDLEFIDPHPVTDCHTPWRFILVTGVLLLLAMCGIFFTIQGKLPNNDWVLLFISTLIAAAAGTSLLSYLRFKKRLIFITRSGRIPLFKVVLDQPFHVHCEQFLEQLDTLLMNCNQKEREWDEFSADELREHRRLQEAGWITQQAYDTAKKRILRLH